MVRNLLAWLGVYLGIMGASVLIILGTAAYIQSSKYDEDYPNYQLAHLANTVVAFSTNLKAEEIRSSEKFEKMINRIDREQIDDQNNLPKIFSITSYGHGDGNIKDELCTNFFNCKSISLGLSDEILSDLPSFWQIISVLGKPCDFIAKPQEGKMFKEYSKSQEIRSTLGCDHLPNKIRFVQLTLYNQTKTRAVDLIIKRQDM